MRRAPQKISYERIYVKFPVFANFFKYTLYVSPGLSKLWALITARTQYNWKGPIMYTLSEGRLAQKRADWVGEGVVGRVAPSGSLSRYRPYLSLESLSMSVNLASAWGRLFPMPALLSFSLTLSLSPSGSLGVS